MPLVRGDAMIHHALDVKPDPTLPGPEMPVLIAALTGKGLR
jgi:hypothetical protein